MLYKCEMLIIYEQGLGYIAALYYILNYYKSQTITNFKNN